MKKISIKVIAIIALIIFGLGLLTLFIYNNNFRVVSTSPENNSTIPSLYYSATINFSEKLKKVNNISSLFTTKNPEIVNSYEQKDSSLIINFKSLGINQEYRFDINNVESESGKKIKLYTYTFKTKYVKYNQLPASTQKTSIDQTDAYEKTYPITNNLPLDISPEYKIEFGSSVKYPNDPSKIALYISSNSNKNTHAALQAIYLFGYDPSDYEIIFQPLEVSS